MGSQSSVDREQVLLSKLGIGEGRGQNVVTGIAGAGLSLCHDGLGTVPGGKGGGVS